MISWTLVWYNKDMSTHRVEVNLKTGKVEIEYTDKLLDQIRLVYGMGPIDEISDDVIVGFLENEVRSALSKLEESNA